MLKKVLYKALKNLTPEEREEVRKALGDGTPAPEENVGEPQGNGTEQSTTVAENAESASDNTETAGAENTEGEASAGENTENPLTEENPVAEQPVNAQGGQVSEVEGEGNGIRIEDLVTQEMLTSRLEALNAKLNAVIDENKALKDKYENPNFGTQAQKGAGAGVNPESRKAANQTFDEYSKQFM